MKKVTMFVWNHFTNDARVNRECTALSENGYDVHLIAIDDPKDDKVLQEERFNDYFKVSRVQRYPSFITAYQKDKNSFLIKVGTVSTVIGVTLLYFNLMLLIYFASLLLMAALSVKLRKVRKNIVNGAIIARMIFKGYKDNADIYHSNDLNTLPQGIICSKFRLKPKKLVYDSHEVQTSRTGYNPKKIKRVESLMLKFVDEMIVENHTRAKKNEELYGFYPHTLYNYSELYNIDDKPDVDLHGELGLPKDEKILLYQGGLQQGRGLELLIEMMPQVKEGTLVFIGAGKLEKTLKDMAKASPASDRIKFIEKVHFKALPSYTKQAYIGFQVLQNICFNHYSASSNKLFEYIMAHVPVVSCNFPEVKAVVDQGVGIAVDSHDVNQIAQAVNKLVSDEALRNQYSEKCKDIKQIYNWENEKIKLIDVYNTL
ncbi:glycosyltransferase [Macrococcoides caseolyticum]|uniref:glycosyltransferase n=1 Tax=Macrococcoides caseolyticum TaxID=69966 RepID=UPI001F41CF68|nr:glycosyltransferase [Macrococcus caseolyticus]MCE4955687.1 glycosyltransferase [Macrococcus caseolyticus]